jgi:branched-subunit amino acid transport protein AzlD
MKIFSLRSKVGLVAWSLGLGVIIVAVLYFWSQKMILVGDCPKKISTTCAMLGTLIDRGWPFSFFDGSRYVYGPQSINSYNVELDLIFWILVALIILSLTRYFRNKKA